jgi:hypothetical protein
MSNQLIPSPVLAPPSIKHLPLAKRIELWYELLDENEALLLSGLRAASTAKTNSPGLIPSPSSGSIHLDV